MTHDEVFTRVRDIIAELFELDAGEIGPESTVFEELDLDSIDAIDLVAKLQQFTGQRIEEDAMRGVRTVGDITRIVAAQLAERASAAS